MLVRQRFLMLTILAATRLLPTHVVGQDRGQGATGIEISDISPHRMTAPAYRLDVVIRNREPNHAAALRIVLADSAAGNPAVDWISLEGIESNRFVTASAHCGEHWLPKRDVEAGEEILFWIQLVDAEGITRDSRSVRLVLGSDRTTLKRRRVEPFEWLSKELTFLLKYPEDTVALATRLQQLDTLMAAEIVTRKQVYQAGILTLDWWEGSGAHRAFDSVAVFEERRRLLRQWLERLEERQP